MNLWMVVEHLLGQGDEAEVLREWRADRWGVVSRSLSELVQEPRVNSFVSQYAASLADDTFDLLMTTSVADAAEAAIDFMEGIVRQAERYSEAMASLDDPAGADEAPLPVVAPADANTIESLALAA